MKIQLSDHFNYKKLILFSLPSIIMLIFTSLYGIVDGLFVTNLVGKTSFATINFIFPVLNILGTIGFLFGAGGSALISKTLGEGDREKANRLFSLFTYLSAVVGIFMGVVGFFVIRPIAELLGAESELLENCVVYGRIMLIALPAWSLQYEFQTFFVTAEKPHLGLAVTVLAGVANMGLDALFIAGFHWGLAGAAAASAASQIVGGVLPFFYFLRKNDSLLRLGKTNFDGKAILKALTNGSSEFVTGVSGSLVGIFYNAQLIRYAGENGVAAYGVIMYVSMIFVAILSGFSSGIAPVVGFHYGAEDKDELKNLRKKSIVVIIVLSIVMFSLSEGLARPFSWLFTRKDPALMDITINAFRLYSFGYLLMGVGIFGSAFFTALNNGGVSAVISLLRTLLFQIGFVILFPLIWELNGIWYSITAAELLATIVTVGFLVGYRKKYGY